MTVYFALEEHTGNIKIGFCESDDPQKDRIGGALTMTTSTVTVQATLLGATVDTEKGLHQAFQDTRLVRADGTSTEFFRPSTELWSLIGHVQRLGELPAPPCGCASLIWVPSGSESERRPQSQKPSAPKFALKKTLAGIVDVLNNHPEFHDAVGITYQDLSDGRRAACGLTLLRECALGTEDKDYVFDKWTGEPPYELMDRLRFWFSKTYDWDAKPALLREAVKKLWIDLADSHALVRNWR